MANVKISDLIPDDHNYNKGNEFGNSLIEKSLRKLGAGRSILLDKNNRIIAGNKTVENAGAIGLEDVQIVESDGKRIIAVKRMDIDLDSKQGREMALADNASAKANIEWNIPALTEDWETEELTHWGITDFEEPPEAVEDDYVIPDEIVTDIVLGDLFEIGGHRLLCGDSTRAEDVARLMGGEKAGITITDPPYNVGKKYTEATDDDKTFDEFYHWCQNWIKHLPTKKLLTVGIKRLMWWSKIIGDPQWIIAWIKKNGQGNTTLGGTNKWDAILVYDCEPDGGIDIIEENNDYSEKIKSKGLHPTAKPVALWGKLIERFCEGNLLYEPFSGTGTTMVAAHQLNRKCYGVEIDPKYCQVIVDRMGKLDPTLIIKKNGEPYPQL